MAAVAGRPWREAANIIIAARCGKSVPNVSNITSKSLARAADRFDYRLLLLQRSAKSKFMPNVFVQPGGVVHTSDYHEIWRDIVDQSAVNIGVSPPPAFTTPRDDGTVSPRIAFSICAIREMFEEAGVLLCSDSAGQRIDTTSLDTDLIRSWRKRINSDPTLFAQMCLEHGWQPKVNDIQVWNNWLTPAHMEVLHGGSARRFDTLFYFHGLPSIPEAQQDEEETVSVKWVSPVELPYAHQKYNTPVSPPLLYECLRLCRLTKYEELCNFARQRELKGTQRCMPVRIDMSDGHLLVLQGDHEYPDDPDENGERPHLVLDSTMAESLDKSPSLNRYEIEDFEMKNPIILRHNVTDPFGHVAPMDLHELFREFDLD